MTAKENFHAQRGSHPPKAEGFDQLLEHVGLGAELLAGGRALLGRSGIALDHAGDLSNLILNLLHRPGLCLGVGGNPVDGFLGRLGSPLAFPSRYCCSFF